MSFPGADEVDNVENAHKIIQLCNKYNFNIYIARLSEYVNNTSVLPKQNSIPIVNTLTEEKFNNILSSISNSVCNDLLLKIKTSLFIRYAKILQCNYIFTAETTTTLAINLLSNIVLGRGSQIENDVVSTTAYLYLFK